MILFINPGKRISKWLFLPVFIAIFSACSQPHPLAPPPQSDTWRVERGTFVSGVEDVGVVRAVRSSSCVASTSGIIARMAPEGTIVKKGTPVLWLENKDVLDRIESETINLKRSLSDYERSLESIEEERFNLEQRLKEARAKFAFDELKAKRAQTELERLRDRYERRLIPEAEVLQGEAALEQARLQELGSRLNLQRAELEYDSRLKSMSIEIAVAKQNYEQSQYQMNQLEVQKQGMIVLAPADGVVVIKRNWNKEAFKVGDRVWQGMQVMEIPDLSEFMVWTQVPETHLQKINVGRNVNLRIPALEHTVLEGVVESISWLAMPRKLSSGTAFTARDEASAGGKVFEVAVRLTTTDDRLRNGMNGSVIFVEESFPNVLTIPVSALGQDDDGAFVFVQRNGRFEFRRVVTGARNRQEAVVSDGLESGERVAIFRVAGADWQAQAAARNVEG